MSNPWREAATVFILAHDNDESNSKYDYKILTFIRTEKTSYFGKNVSLPGGGVDPTDNSISWKNFFAHHKISINDLESDSKKPLIYKSRGHELPRETSLRISAIRETFEEVGIVLYKNPENTSKFSSCFHSQYCDIPCWQEKIHNKHETLMSFYDQNDLVPDLFKIYEWSVWLTPTFSRKRYEAAFFILALEHIPPVYAEVNEVQSFSWNTPEELLELHYSQQIWIPPPIYYELHRFLNQPKLDKILNFAAQRNGKDIPLIYPIPYNLKDASMTLIYPGDDLYPENPHLYDTVHNLQKYESLTYDEFAKGCENFCRIEMKEMYARNFMCNVDDGLLPAVTLKAKNKL